MFNRRKHRELESKLVEAWIDNFFLKRKVADLEKATAGLVRAIRDKGAVPQYHNHVMKKHRDEWPALWQAIDNIVKAHDLQEKE